MDTAAHVPAGRVVFLHELERKQDVEQATRTNDTTSVRVLGTLQDYDVQANRALLTSGRHRLSVDTSLLGAFAYEEQAMYQIIGELEWISKGEKVWLKQNYIVIMDIHAY
jgi:hypothetical protein